MSGGKNKRKKKLREEKGKEMGGGKEGDSVGLYCTKIIFAPKSSCITAVAILKLV